MIEYLLSLELCTSLQRNMCFICGFLFMAQRILSRFLHFFTFKHYLKKHVPMQITYKICSFAWKLQRKCILMVMVCEVLYSETVVLLMKGLKTVNRLLLHCPWASVCWVLALCLCWQDPMVYALISLEVANRWANALQRNI